MIIATFGPTTAWNGRTIDYEAGTFTVQGVGPVTNQDVMKYDASGHLVWAYDGLREWVGEQGAQPTRTNESWQQSWSKRNQLVLVPAMVVGIIVLFALLFLAIRIY